MNRRLFLSRSLVLSGGAVGLPQISRSADTPTASNGQKPARIIHMVADGMSMGTLTGADYLSHHLRGRGLSWLALQQGPGTCHGLMNMRSLDSMVTDSAAASSSWGSGSRVKNGVLNRLPDGTALKTLYELFADIGWKRGLVTTTEITHATPAGFAACVDSRDTGTLIASQYLERKVDVLLGGGRKFFEARRRKDKRDLKAEFAAAGYQVMNNAAELTVAPVEKPWLGTFYDSHLPFTLDRQANPELRTRVPELATMTRRALEWLGRHDHFILQIEGGRVDHGAHNCDAAAALRDQLAFDEAVDEVLAFRRQHPDTLVVLTTDHGTGSLSVNGSGTSYGKSSQLFQQVAGIKASFPEILRQLRKKPTEVDGNAADDEETTPTSTAATTTKPADYVPTTQEIRAILEATTAYKMTDKRAAAFQAFLAKKGSTLYDAMNSETTQLGQLLANHIAVGWAGSSHTADYVPVTAIGPGAERFAGFIQNVDVFRHYTGLAGIEFKNPERALIAGGALEPGAEEHVGEYA